MRNKESLVSGSDDKNSFTKRNILNPTADKLKQEKINVFAWLIANFSVFANFILMLNINIIPIINKDVAKLMIIGFMSISIVCILVVKPTKENDTLTEN